MPGPALGESCTTSITYFAIFPSHQKKKKINRPYNYRINVINNLIEKVRCILQKNNYPPSVVNSSIKKMLHHLSLQTAGMNSQPHHPQRITPLHTQTTHPKPAVHSYNTATQTSLKYICIYILSKNYKNIIAILKYYYWKYITIYWVGNKVISLFS